MLTRTKKNWCCHQQPGSKLVNSSMKLQLALRVAQPALKIIYYNLFVVVSNVCCSLFVALPDVYLFFRPISFIAQGLLHYFVRLLTCTCHRLLTTSRFATLLPEASHVHNVTTPSPKGATLTDEHTMQNNNKVNCCFYFQTMFIILITCSQV